MPYAPWISPKSGNYLHSRQVRKRQGPREGERNYSRSAKLLPGRSPNFTERAIFYRVPAAPFDVSRVHAPTYTFALLCSLLFFLSLSLFFPSHRTIHARYLLFAARPCRTRHCACARACEPGCTFTLLSISLPRFGGTFDALP